MIGKIVQGADFRGVVNYVLQKPDAEPLGGRGLRNDSIDHIVDSFRMQASLNPITKPVAHISLDFSVQDKERLTNKMMMQIADEYLHRMGYGDTQVLIVRHNDREHPHLHLVLNRIDGNGKRISDKNERVRNAKVCRELSDKYGLYIAPNKENVKRHRLREPDKTKYEIYDAIRNALPRCRNWNDLTSALRKQGINTEFKRKGSTSTIEGVKFSKNGYTFSGSKVDKAFSYSKLNHHFAQAQQRISQQPTPGKRMKMAADNYRSAFSGLFNNYILVTDRGTIGKIQIVPKHWNGWAVSQNVIKVVPASIDISGYLYAYMATDFANVLIKRETYGSVVDMIDNNNVASIVVPLLKDKSVQQKINDLVLEANELRYQAYLKEQEAINKMNEIISGKI